MGNTSADECFKQKKNSVRQTFIMKSQVKKVKLSFMWHSVCA